MAKHTLFLIHGMGRHEGNHWSDQIWEKLIECSRRYPHFADMSLDQYAEPFPVEYDGLIRETLERWGAAGNSFAEFAQQNDLNIEENLDWLADLASDDAGFGLTHIADVIICRFFTNEFAQIRAKVQSEIFVEIHRKRSLDASTPFSLMAHSLGTSIAHDALAELGAASHIGDQVNTFGVENFRFDSLHMIANVSRLLQTSPEAYESIIRPGANRTKNRYCQRMFCADHELDPFTKPKPFNPGTWGNRFELTMLDHYRGWNVHGWLHYLDHPRVHIPLLKSITKPSAIGPSQARKAIDNYPRYGGDLENLTEAKQKIAELHALVQTIDRDKEVKENLSALQDMWQALNELKGIGEASWARLEQSLP